VVKVIWQKGRTQDS